MLDLLGEQKSLSLYCHLNRYESAGELARVYDVTTPTTEQKDILAALGLGRLVVDAEVAERVEPRPL